MTVMRDGVWRGDHRGNMEWSRAASGQPVEDFWATTPVTSPPPGVNGLANGQRPGVPWFGGARPTPSPALMPTPASGPAVVEPGSEAARLAKINELKGGHAFPKWDHAKNDPVRPWSVPEMKACAAVINNTLAEVTESAIDHDRRRKHQKRNPMSTLT